MARQQSQIEEVEKRITGVSNILQQLYAQLGELALPLDDFVITKESKPLYTNFFHSVEQSNSIKARLGKFKDISASFKNNTHRLKELVVEKKEQEELLKLLYSRIGVIVWEEASSGVLDSTILEAIPNITVRQKESILLSTAHAKAKERREKSSLLLKLPLSVDLRVKSLRLKKHTSKYNEFFVYIGKIVATNTYFALLHSTRSSLFEKEYASISQAIEDITEESAMIGEQIRFSRHKLEQEGINGSLARKINEIESEYKEANKVRNHAAILYGKHIAAILDVTHSQSYLPHIIDCYDQIIRHQELKTELLRTIKKLTIEKKIEELVLLLQQDEDHIAHIELSIGQLNRQIEEINKMMASKKEQIGTLQQQLNKVLLIENTDGNT
jgi:hypothetical protein